MAIMLFVTTLLLLSHLLSYITASFKVTLKIMRTEHCDKTVHEQMKISWYLTLFKIFIFSKSFNYSTFESRV